jgi:hypothetical protein
MSSEEYRLLAEDCKQLIDKKDKIIKIYQERIDDADTKAKKLEHEIIKCKTLLNLLLELWSKKNELIVMRNMDNIFIKMKCLISDMRELLIYHENEDDILSDLMIF